MTNLTCFRMDTVVKELDRLQENNFWGKVTIMFQNGKMVYIEKLEGVKPNNGTQEGVFREDRGFSTV